jgi:hypothetical protein
LPHPCSPRLIRCSTPPPPLVVDCSSLIMLLSFVWRKGFNLPSDCAGLCFWGWVGELYVVCVAHLLDLQIAGSFETSCLGEIACYFSQGKPLLELGSVRQGIGRLSIG